MNFCNFAKIIIARNSKETQNTTETTGETTTIRIPVFNNNVTVAKRYDFYQNVMNKYPKMYLTSKAFASNLPRLQKYITESKFWKNGNRNGEKSKFIENFNLQSWNKLSEREKHMHRLIDCIKCEASNPTISSMHSSVSDTTQNIIKKTNELAQEIENMHAARLVDGAEQLVKMIEPIMENTFKTSMKKTVSTQYNLTEKVPSEKKQRQKIKSTKESSEKIAKIISNNDCEVASFLASGNSFSQRNRDRMNTYFETTQAARLRTARKTQKLTAGVQKPKRHVGKLGNYLFDRDAFQKFIEALPSGSKVSWRDLGIRFQVKNKSGLRPSNAGQVLMEAAKSLGIDVSKFNTEKRISGRDYAQRIRRARHKLMYQKVSIPASQPTRKLHTEIRRRLNNQEIYVGELIAPKTYRRNHITSSGDLEETEVTVHGRKIPLVHIRRQMNVDQGLLFRWRKDDYENLDEETILKRFSKLKIPVPSEPMSALDELMKAEHTRNLKVWHDHSDILNHSYVSFMISALYDTAVFLTDEEFKERYPDRTPVDVQSAVEKPYLYILGQSKATDVDQLSYTSTRLEDINSLHQPTYFKGTAIYDVLRVFSGDGPARQFEAGHQRGGNFSCLCGISVKEHQNLECALRFHPPTLSERMKILKSGVLWKEYSERNINPLCNLKKEALTDELEARGVDTYGKSAAEMKEKLVEILHGIQRPPALLGSDIHSLSLSRYEIPPCEPLHDLSNIVQNLITELPTHIEDNKVQVDFEKFANATIGDKNQLKGSDARLFAVKLAKFAHQKFTENGIPKEILLLCTSLVEMISICYSHHHQRTPKTILRLYNQSFLFSVLCKTVIGTPKKMTTRKFYGCHFHSMTVHAPQTFRIFCLRSLIPEQEERSFGDMRRISLNTSSRQCGKIIDNAIVRFNAQQQSDRGDNYRRQESAISQQARLLPTGEDTRFPIEMLRTRSYLFQTHCERIADFLQEGLGIWWSMDGDDIVFHDGPMHQDQSLCSQHFRTDTVADSIKILDNCWSKCVSAFEKGEIQLPLLKVKIFDGSKPKIIRNENLLAQNQAQCLLTGKSGQRADEDHESEREEESADSEMQLVSGLLAQNHAECLLTGKSGQRADEDHESEREEESADSQMQLVSDLLAQNQAEGPLTGKSVQQADEDHESEREEESADSEMQLVSGGLVAINRSSIHTEENQESTRYSKIVDLGAEAVDCNEITAQGTKHRDMDRPPLIPLLHNTDPRPACESEQHMIDASQDVEKGSSACISLLQNTGRQSREQSVKVKSCKRKLFDENSDKESMSKKILLLLPDHPTLTEYSKYRRLVKARPDDKSLSRSYEQALTKLQLAVSKRHRELKESNSGSSLVAHAEDLMRYWKMYFY